MKNIPIRYIIKEGKDVSNQKSIWEDDEPEPDTFQELKIWWLSIAENEADSVIPKTVEYGAGGADNMVMLGQVLATSATGGAWSPSKAKAIELAAAFYTLSKVTRWINALTHGQDASDDTLHDIACYLKIAQRTRKVGGWPGVGN